MLKSLINDLREKQSSNTPIKVTALLGMLKDKDATELVEILKTDIDEWITAPIIDERGQSAEILADKLEKVLGNRPFTSNSIPEGCTLALSHSQQQDIIIIFGSFHMMAESLTWLKENQYV